jgi:hypothetical protein
VIVLHNQIRITTGHKDATPSNKGREFEPTEISDEVYFAAYNYVLVRYDGSYGIHNPTFTVQYILRPPMRKLPPQKYNDYLRKQQKRA